MAEPNWAIESGSPSVNASMAAAAAGGATDEIADRTSVITARLKTIYRKTVLPVEKRKMRLGESSVLIQSRPPRLPGLQK